MHVTHHTGARLLFSSSRAPSFFPTKSSEWYYSSPFSPFFSIYRSPETAIIGAKKSLVIEFEWGRGVLVIGLLLIPISSANFAIHKSTEWTLSPGAQPSMAAASVYGENSSAPPERVFQECRYYMKTGDCNFGASCKYHHPLGIIKGKLCSQRHRPPLHPVQRISHSPSSRFQHHQRAPDVLLNQFSKKMAHCHQHPVLQRWQLLYIAFLEKGLLFYKEPVLLLTLLSDYGIAEITWGNGQPAMHGLGRASETLESIVHQATTCYNQSQNQEIDLQQSRSLLRSHNLSSNVASSSAKWGDSAGQSYHKKRPRSSAVFHDQCENQEEECRNETETTRSQSSRRSRAAAIHNQTEWRQRERINRKMKALQKLNKKERGRRRVLVRRKSHLKIYVAFFPFGLTTMEQKRKGLGFAGEGDGGGITGEGRGVRRRRFGSHFTVPGFRFYIL
ncbi:hypothetical protein L6452_12230 [Arctium lappa]|uniref:Uncharacterized protein n=1 Tax=Arctium lappa TaxID=4217 RepID=A0ACB9DQ83_ARCLA|nr:hypothetical protein L6452_12230 [Arctium lappa]